MSSIARNSVTIFKARKRQDFPFSQRTVEAASVKIFKAEIISWTLGESSVMENLQEIGAEAMISSTAILLIAEHTQRTM